MFYGSINSDKEGNDKPAWNGSHHGTEKKPLINHNNDNNHNGKNGLLSSSSDGLVKEQNARCRSIWSLLVFKWFIPILQRGNEMNQLDQEDLDLVPLPEDCSTEHVNERFERYWQLELKSNPLKPSMVKVLFRAFGADFLRGALLKLVHDLCLFVGPKVLHDMIIFLRQPGSSIWKGIGLTIAVTLSRIAMTMCLRHYFFYCYITGLRVRTAIVTAVYHKALVLSSGERQTRTLGEITNLMSIDAQRLQDLTTYLNAIWSSPLQIALSLYFLWRQLGPSSIGGVLVIIIMIPVTKKIAQWMGRMQKQLMAAKDKRVELNGEVLSRMKIIKFQAWEESFQKRILDLREAELAKLFRYFIGTSFSRTMWTFTPLAVAVATFSVFVWAGNQLDVASALTALALFDILRFPLNMLPNTINNIVEALISLKRVRSFLLCEEHHPIGPGELKEHGMELQGVSAAYDTKRPVTREDDTNPKTKELLEKNWEITLLRSQLEEAEKHIRQLKGKQVRTQLRSPSSEVIDSNLLCLRRIDFKCKPGEFIAVVGGVGCGKSSFINALLGEVRLLSGTIAVNGKLAYFPQTPFILNASVRDNILFGHIGEPVDEALYQRALDSCALRYDLNLLPHGDETEIGEKGITLSGGQKARIALARAVYHGADITLIDDALSAVDAHVAKHLFKEALLKELLGESRSVVLVTNALQHLNHPRVDKIVVIQGGRIVEEGTYSELASKTDSVFARYLSVIEKNNVTNNLEEREDENATIDSNVTEVHETKQSAWKSLSKDAKLMTEEAREKGHVEFGVYISWARAAGGAFIVPAVIFLTFGGVEAISVLANWWITYWSANGDSSQERQYYFLGIYALINVATALASMCRMIMLFYVGLRSSRQLFAEMLEVVLHGKMSFFDTTPVGRLINRFSKDMYTVDEKLTSTMRMYVGNIFSILSTIVVISGVMPIFIVFLIPMIIFYMGEQAFFTLTYRELKRLDSVSRSPIYALLGESVDGVAVIRAFSAQQTLFDRLKAMLDKQQHAYFLTCAAQSWVAVRLELVGTLIASFACLSAVVEHAIVGADETFAGLAGLAISYSLSVTQSLNWSVRMASDLEANMVAVERIIEYTKIQSEGARTTEKDATLPTTWPEKGDIVFERATLCYRPELPLVLKGLDIHIPSGSKVGCVGRTGAGKSTLMVALMRIVEVNEGRILIDGVDIKTVGLARLRRNIAVIPQDPVLFSGTLRTNLDPFGDYSDEALYEALKHVGLFTSQGAISDGLPNSLLEHRVESLEDAVTEGGSNFSVGQRQLIVIARALLCGTKIVIMDEATASVDAETDAAIQQVLRNQFADATCLTVAHRLNTIMDSDYILVMDDGKAVEFNTPNRLLQCGGMFRDLVKAESQNSSNGVSLG